MGISLAAAVWLTAAGAAAEQEGRMLFLAHFDRPSLEADYASGSRGAAALSGARGGDLGRFGGAADLGYRTQSTASLAFPAAGNVDARQGTIEFFVKTAWDWSTEGLAGQGWQHQSSVTFVHIHLQQQARIHVYLYHHEPSGQCLLAFNLFDGTKDHFLGAGVSPVGKREVPEPWKKDQWHHVAVSWTPTTSRIFADGKLVATKSWDPPLALAPAGEGMMSIGGEPTGASRVLIDELRILDVALEQVAVPTQPYPTPRADEKPAAPAATAPWATIPCYRVAAAPTIDGALDEAAWKQVPWVGGLRNWTNLVEFARIPTRFAVCWDEEALYFAFVCSEPNMAGLKAVAQGPDAQVFGDDAVEVFIDPLRRQSPYYQLAFNTTMNRYDGRGTDAKWDGDWTVKVARGATEWTAELRVPFATLAEKPAAGQVWGLNVARDRLAGGGLELSSWSPLGGGFHNVRGYGALRLEPGSCPSVPKDEAAINARYIKETTALVDSQRRLWQRQVERARRQVAARTTAAALGPEVKRLAGLVERLASPDTSVAALDQARLAMLGLGRDVDRLTADVQQTAPLGAMEPPADLGAGLVRRGDLWYFASDQAVFAVDGRTGILAGLWHRKTGRRCVTASADHYWLETVAAVQESDEQDDQAAEPVEKDGRLTLRCTNPDLPGVTLVKEYWLKPGGAILAKRVTSSCARPAEKTLLRVSCRTYFDRRFLEKAYYQQLLHPAVIVPCMAKASTLTDRTRQPGFMGQSPDGSSQFCASDLASGLGVGQFLLTINGRHAYPPRSLNMSYWTPWGWEMSWWARFLHEGQAHQVEMDTLLYEGDHFTFHTLYQDLPEYRATLASWSVHPWSAWSRGLTMCHVNWSAFSHGGQPHPDILEYARIPSHLVRPDEVIYYLQQAPGDNWGEYPAGDGEKARFREPNSDRFKQEVPAEAIRRGIQGIHDLKLPYWKLGFYQFVLDVSPGTPPERAGWYIVDKHGRPVSGWYDPSFKTYLGDFSPEWIDYTVKGLIRQLDYYGADYIYLDYPYLPCFADWKGAGRVIQPTEVMEFYRRLHGEISKRGKALFVNAGAGVPYVDAGYFEGITHPATLRERGFLQDGWKTLISDPLLMMKLYEPPGFASYVLSWVNKWSEPEPKKDDNTREIVNYALLLGCRVSGASWSEYGDQLKAFTPPGGKPSWLANARSVDMFHRASMELGASRVVDVGLRPCWWREDTRLEAYALRLGPAHVLTCVSHHDNDRPASLSADVKKLGLHPGRRTFVWTFHVRSPKTIVRQPDPPPAGWDRLCAEIGCRSFLQETAARLDVDLGTLPPLLVRLAAVTQVPGAIVSAYGQETQFVLPHNLGCKVDGTVDEAQKEVRLQVDADKPCEVIAWWPAAWGKAAAAVGAQAIPAERFVVYGPERFVRLALPAGKADVVLRPGRP